MTELHPIEDFLLRTNTHDTVLLAESMGSLARYVEPEHFRAFCFYFAKGAQYVEEHFGTVPEHIVITDENRDSPYYHVDTKTVVIPQKYIGALIGYGYSRQSKTDPFALDYTQAAFAYGVEEALHHYTIATEGLGALKDQRYQPGDPRYDTQYIEAVAKKIVQEALRDHYEPMKAAGLTFAVDKNPSFSR